MLLFSYSGFKGSEFQEEKLSEVQCICFKRECSPDYCCGSKLTTGRIVIAHSSTMPNCIQSIHIAAYISQPFRCWPPKCRRGGTPNYRVYNSTISCFSLLRKNKLRIVRASRSSGIRSRKPCHFLGGSRLK